MSMQTNEELSRYFELMKDDDFVSFLRFIYPVATADFHINSKDIISNLLEWKNRFQDDREFFLSILTMDSQFSFFCTHNGKVFSNKIEIFADKFRRLASNPCAYSVYLHKDIVDNMAQLLKLRIDSTYPRISNSFEKYFHSCHNSVAILYFRVVLTNEDEAKYPSLGNENSQIMYIILRDMLKWIDEVIASSPDLKSVSMLGKLPLLGFTETQVDILNSFYERIGYFPIFKAISLKIDSLAYRDKEIINYCLNIFQNNQMLEMQDVALRLNLTRERVRQLRNRMIDELRQIVKDFESERILSDFEYNSSTKSEIKSIKEREEVAFNDNFIIWSLSILNCNYQLIGNWERLFFKFPPVEGCLCLVPKSLSSRFNFELFIDAIDNAISEKRYYEYRIEIEAFVDRLCDEKLGKEEDFEVIKECRKILERCYPEHLINNQIVFYVNSRKVLPDIIEDILREINQPMTAETLSEEINKRYPDMCMTPSKIRANALRNNNVIAVSRKSTYALADWNETSKRGGTIRDIALEYLNSLIEPIAPLSNICEFISQFREDIKESSVKANLLAESTNKFSLYYKDNDLFIGLTEYHFDESFKTQLKRQGRRSFEDSLHKLEQFIISNERFPFSSGVDAEEIRLSRFYLITKQKINNGTITPQEQAEIERIESMYGHYKTKKNRASWMQHLENYTAYLTNNNALPPGSSIESSWYMLNKELYDNNMLDDNKQNAFSYLIRIVERMKQ